MQIRVIGGAETQGSRPPNPSLRSLLLRKEPVARPLFHISAQPPVMAIWATGLSAEVPWPEDGSSPVLDVVKSRLEVPPFISSMYFTCAGL